MEKSFRQLLKEYFTFSKKDRNGILFLGALIFIVIIGVVILDNISLNAKQDFTNFKKALEAWEKENSRKTEQKRMFAFNPNTISEAELDSLSIPEFVKKNIISYRAAGGKFKQAADLSKIYGMNDSIFEQLETFIVLPSPPLPREEKVEKEDFSFSGAFDPNNAGADLLSEFGFNDFQASNLISYRENGGVFTQPEELLKIYGIDSAFFSKIEKHVDIDEIPIKSKDLDEPENIPVAEFKIDINTADSTDLIQLKGIGNIFARRILKYRELLGGFYCGEQLMEVYHFPEETFNNIRPNILIDSLAIKKIRLNFAGYSDFLRHPYIKQEYVEKIISYREKNGSFKSLEQFQKANLLDSVTYRQVKPYLSCR